MGPKIDLLKATEFRYYSSLPFECGRDLIDRIKYSIVPTCNPSQII